MHLFLSGIECVAGDTRLVIEKASVDQVVEYAVAPLPLTWPWVAGLATHGKDLVVSVRVDARIPDGTPKGGDDERDTLRRSESPRLSKAVLIASKRGGAGRTRWGLEVDEVTSFVEVALRRDAAPPHPTFPWLVPGRTTQGVDIVWVDVERMMRELEAAAVTR